MDFSLIVPCFNEEENLRVFHSHGDFVFRGIGCHVRVGISFDGSSDATYQVIQDQIEAYRSAPSPPRKRTDAVSRFQVVGFSRNFGKEAAMYAGLERATGDVLGFIDADMHRTPPLRCACSACSEMTRPTIASPPCRNSGARACRCARSSGSSYRMFRDMNDLDVVEGASDFRVFTRQVAAALLSMREHFRFSKGMFRGWASTRV